jgi:hypothetical protein
LSDTGVKHFKKAGHRRAASQALVSCSIKKKQIKVSDLVLMSLQQIYHNCHARPWSKGQAAVLELVHHPSPTQLLVIVLPTSSGKSALFFLVTATTCQQTVIIIMLFAALVNNIISHEKAARLNCKK